MTQYDEFGCIDITMPLKCLISYINIMASGACPGIGERGGPKSESLFFFFFFFFLLFNFSGGGSAQKRAEKIIFYGEKVAKYR